MFTCTCIVYLVIFCIFTFAFVMSNNNSNLVVLQNLPRFRGNLRASEKHRKDVTPSINVRTFLRALENHYSANRINDDERKLRILYAQIDKSAGDAVDLVNCYAGRDVAFDEVKNDFLAMYPEFRRTDFRYAARSILDLNINEPTMFCGMTRHENETRALAESYLGSDSMKELGFDIDTKVKVGEKEFTLLSILQNNFMHLRGQRTLLGSKNRI